MAAGQSGNRNRFGRELSLCEEPSRPFFASAPRFADAESGIDLVCGAYLDGTEPFADDTEGGDLTFREIPTEIEAADLAHRPWL